MCGTNTTTNIKAASRVLLSTAAVTVVFAGLYASPASAQGIVLDEVIVTAQKREQSLEDVPASVSSISGDTVRDYLGSAENIRALAGRVPSLNIESSNGRIAPRFYIRGLGNIDFDVNANQPVGMVYDDISLENNVLRSLPLFDIERVEVLKGPQGSLFGRNSNAGIVKIDSVRPSDERNAYASISYGDNDTVGAEFATNIQASDSVSMRASFKYLRRSDWIDNIVNGPGDDFGGFDEYAWRLQFLIEPNDTFTGLIKLHGFSQDGSQPQVFYANSLEVGSAGLRPGFDETIASHDGAAACIAAGIAACAGHELDHYGMSANLVWDLDAFTFTSITGYDTVENFQSTDVDGGLISFDAADIGALGRQVFFGVATGDGLKKHYQWTQEFRIAKDTEKVFFQGGLFMFEENYDVLNRDFGGGYDDIVNQETSSYAIFGQADWSITDRFSVVAGLRYTSDDKNLAVRPGVGSPSPAATIDIDDDYISWDLAFTYDVSENWNIYGRLANASRGPVTLGRFGFTSSAETETSDSVELGFKSDLMGGRARWNAAIYSFRNDDQQLTATGGTGNVNQLLNADRVNGEGFETDFEILFTDNLLFIANASYNDTEIDDPDLRDDLCGSSPQCTPLDPIVGLRPNPPFGIATEVSIDGNPLPRTPDWVYNLILQWTIPVGNGDVYVHTDWNYRAESNIFLHESVEFVAEDRWLGGLRIGYRSESGLDVALVGRNVTDEVVVDGAINFLNLTTFINEPRYWGVELRKDW